MGLDRGKGEKIYTIYQAMNGWVLERGWDGGWVVAETAEDALGILADYIEFEETPRDESSE